MSGEIKYKLNEKLVIYGLSLLLGVIIVVASLFLASLLCLAGDLPESISSPLFALCVGVGAFSAGFLSSKKIRSGGILNGAVCGFLLYALTFFLSLIFSESGFSFISVFHLLIIVISAMIGGVFGVMSGTKRKYI